MTIPVQAEFPHRSGIASSIAASWFLRRGYRRSLRHQSFEFFFMDPGFNQQFRQESQQQAEQQAKRDIRRQPESTAPALARGRAQVHLSYGRSRT